MELVINVHLVVSANIVISPLGTHLKLGYTYSCWKTNSEPLLQHSIMQRVALY